MKVVRKRFKKVYKVVFYILVGWLFIGSFVFIFYPWFLADKLFLNSSYNVKIKAIEFREGHRGFPHIKLDTGWYLLNVDEIKIIPYAQTGDSIVKKSGSSVIKVYRKDLNGKLVIKEFE